MKYMKTATLLAFWVILGCQPVAEQESDAAPAVNLELTWEILNDVKETMPEEPQFLPCQTMVRGLSPRVDGRFITLSFQTLYPLLTKMRTCITSQMKEETYILSNP